LVEVSDEAVSALAGPVDPAFVREFQRSTTVRPLH
jgi:hypothetical protein